MGCYNIGLGSYQKWFIGNDIRDILISNEDITAQVGDNIYPCIAPLNTEGDYIIYMRNKYAKSTVKQGVYMDECEVAVVVVSDNYDNAIALASKGGTAFPTCLNCCVLFPMNTKSSGNDCILAHSLTVGTRLYL